MRRHHPGVLAPQVRRSIRPLTRHSVSRSVQECSGVSKDRHAPRTHGGAILLLHRVRIAILACAFAYTATALWLAYEDHAQITVLIIPPLGITLAVIWLGWRAWAALGDVHAILAGRTPARPAPRATSLADYMPPATEARPAVNRVA